MIYAHWRYFRGTHEPCRYHCIQHRETLSLQQVLPYIANQLAGAMLASVSLRFLFPAMIHWVATLPAGSAMQSFCWSSCSVSFNAGDHKCGDRQQRTGMFAGLAISSTVLLEGHVYQAGVWRKHEPCEEYLASHRFGAPGTTLDLYRCTDSRGRFAIPYLTYFITTQNFSKQKKMKKY